MSWIEIRVPPIWIGCNKLSSQVVCARYSPLMCRTNPSFKLSPFYNTQHKYSTLDVMYKRSLAYPAVHAISNQDLLTIGTRSLHVMTQAVI